MKNSCYIVEPSDLEKSKQSSVQRNPTTLTTGQVFGPWTVVKKINEGGFGAIYKVQHESTKEFAALKCESSKQTGGAAIKLEAKLLKLLLESETNPKKEHLMQLFMARRKRDYHYMVVTLLGDNLLDLLLDVKKEKFSVSTWSRLGIQCLYCIKLVHDVGYVHRDIKPNNFVLGYRKDPARRRIVHIVDFGLARCFAVQDNKTWLVRKARANVVFRGTVRYCSPAAHEKFEQGRKDDLYSLLYMLIDFHKTLPWAKTRDTDSMEMVKIHISDEKLLKKCPPELGKLLAHLKTLNCYNRPDYNLFYDMFVKMMKNNNAKYIDRYDFEEEEDYANYAKNGVVMYPSYIGTPAAAEFFALDNMNINSGPKKGDKTFADLRDARGVVNTP